MHHFPQWVVYIYFYSAERGLGLNSDSENNVPRTEHTFDRDMWVVYHKVRGHNFTKCILSLHEKSHIWQSCTCYITSEN